MINYCIVCGIDYEYSKKVGYSKDLCGPYCDGINTGKKNIAELEAKLAQAQELAIWMTGCGYDFKQHPYYIKEMDKMTAGIVATGSSEIDIPPKPEADNETD